MVDAPLKAEQAKKLRKLAESMNTAIPNYQNAAQQAAIHVMATFSGLQLPGRGRGAWARPAPTPEASAEAPTAATSALARQAQAAGARVDAGLIEFDKAFRAAKLAVA